MTTSSIFTSVINARLKRQLVSLASLTAHNTTANSAYNQTNFNTPNSAGLNVANFTPATSTIGPGPTTITTDPTKQDRSLNPVTPGHVSFVDVHTLIPSRPDLLWQVHAIPWWGSPNEPVHMGIQMFSAAYAKAWIDNLIARGFNGVEINWNYNDTGTYASDNLVKFVQAYIDTLPAGKFYFVINVDQGTIDGLAAGSRVSALTTAVNYIKNTYFSDANYMHVGGKPVVMFYGCRNAMNVVTGGGAAAMNTVKSNVGVSMYWSDVDVNGGFLGETWEDAAYDWHDAWFGGVNGSDPYNLGSVGTFLTAVSNASTKQGIGAMAGGYNETLVRPNGGGYLQQDSGKCIVQRASYINTHIPSNIKIMHWVTWNDYPEGTGAEPGYENNVTVTATISGTSVTWTHTSGTGDEQTIDHYEIYASPDSVNAAYLGSAATGISTFSLIGRDLVAGHSYTAYVYAVGKPGIRNHISAGVSFTGP